MAKENVEKICTVSPRTEWICFVQVHEVKIALFWGIALITVYEHQDQTNSFILGNQSPYLNSPIFLFFREIATTTMKLQKRLWHLCNQLDWEVLWPKMHALLQNQFYSVFILVAHSFGFSNRRERRDTYIISLTLYYITKT